MRRLEFAVTYKKSILRLLNYPAASHPTVEVFFKGRNLLAADEAELREIRVDSRTLTPPERGTP